MDVVPGLLAAFGTAAAKSGTDISTKISVKSYNAHSLLALTWLTSAAILTGITLAWYPALLTNPVETLPAMTTGNFWPVLFAGGTLNAIASYFYICAFREADASLVAPLMLLTPILLLVTSPLMLGERVPLLGVCGILFAVAGSYQLGKTDKPASFLDTFKALSANRGVRSMLVTVSIWSITSNLDKMGVLASTPLLWAVSISYLVSLYACLYWLIFSRHVPTKASWSFLLPGMGQATQAILQNTALTLLLVPYVISIKRTSAIMTIMFSAVFLKEKTYKRLEGALIMIAGTVMMALASSR